MFCYDEDTLLEWILFPLVNSSYFYNYYLCLKTKVLLSKNQSLSHVSHGKTNSECVVLWLSAQVADTLSLPILDHAIKKFT
jgi:hypothetical protein